jgi:CheY-like chemotaxis protein
MQSLPSPAAKYALLVERVDGRLNDLNPVLKRLGYQVVRAAETQAVAGLLRSLRRLSLIVVNGDTLKGDSAELFVTIKQLHPELPVAWLTSNLAATRPPSAAPELLTDDLKKVEEWLSRRVREELYSARLTQKLVVGFQRVLTTLGLPSRASEPSLRLTRSTLGEINALILLCAERLSGYLIVSASRVDLTQAHRAQLPRALAPTDEDLEDLLGEAANQLTGEVRRQVDLGGLSAPLPHFLRGVGCSHRHKAGAPSLAIDFSKREQKLNVEICIHRRDGNAVQGSVEGTSLRVGELNLL